MYCLIDQEAEPASRTRRLAHYRRYAPFTHLAPPERDEQGRLTHEVWGVESNEEGRANLNIIGPIDQHYGFNPAAIIQHFDQIENLRHIHMNIGSPGGFVELAMMVYSDLRHRAEQGVRVTAEGRGLIASAGLDIFLAADERQMDSATLAMTHPIEGLDIVHGTRDEIADNIDNLLNQMDAFIAQNMGVFRDRTSASDETLAQWLQQKGETWFSAEQAFEHGITTVAPTQANEDPDNDDDSASMQQQTDPERLRHMMDRALSL